MDVRGVISKAVRATSALAAGLLASTAIVGCSSAQTKPVTTRAPTVAVVNLLTGVGPSPGGPVVAVKLDDTAAGRPSLGWTKPM